MGLKSILGESLLEKMKTLIAEDKLENHDNIRYKYLVNKCQYYLAYMTIVELIFKVSYKIGNAGVVKASDENMQVASMSELVAQKEYYQSKADWHCLEIQNYILENRSDFPEADDCTCNKIHSNLYSAASCGIFLGGVRGKRRVCV